MPSEYLLIERRVARSIETVIKNCNCISVSQSIDKEPRGWFYSLLNLFYSIFKALGERGKFGAFRAEDVEIPKRVEKELEKLSASKFDAGLVNLAFKSVGM
jgi:hypothetical protein